MITQQPSALPTFNKAPSLSHPDGFLLNDTTSTTKKRPLMKSPRAYPDNSPIDRKGGNETPKSHLAGVMAKHMKSSSRSDEIEVGLCFKMK